jgi:putative flippase GtrA
MLELARAHSDKVRFALVGTLNTTSDFIILNILAVLLGLPVILANTISTGLCMMMSFLLNKKWTFKSTGKSYLREVTLFFVFTIISVWVIGNGVMMILVPLMPADWPEFMRISFPKVVATVVSLAWNYSTYKFFVFKVSDKN